MFITLSAMLCINEVEVASVLAVDDVKVSLCTSEFKVIEVEADADWRSEIEDWRFDIFCSAPAKAAFNCDRDMFVTFWLESIDKVVDEARAVLEAKVESWLVRALKDLP